MAAADWLKLARANGLHGNRLDELLARFGNPAGITAERAGALVAAGLPEKDAERILASGDADLHLAETWLDQPGHFMLTWSDPAYPALLRAIPDPPIVLFGSGNPDVLSLPQLAIVGSRKATAGGVDTARRFAAHMARAGLCITSGLALGIDAAAHGGALQAKGITVAVCGTGPDQVYPPAHRALAAEIAHQGAVITQYPPGTPAKPANFPQRNRIISGLSLGTLVVEAGVRSGALITARLAGEQGREVFAVPGSIHNPVARGCHRLIRQGAKLVETAQDIAEELGGIIAAMSQSIEQNVSSSSTKQSFEADPEYAQLLACMGWDPVSANQLVERSGLTAADVSSMLLILELAGRVEPLAGGRYQQREEGRSR
jgi:DNA processing protein